MTDTISNYDMQIGSGIAAFEACLLYTSPSPRD